MESAIGFDNLIWYIGIVENESDPTRQGRVQVRCFGIHPPADSGDLLTEDLPWAPVLNAGHGGTILPTKGDWVFGGFIDGRDAQHPFVFGTIPGSNTQLPTNSGSSDPYTKASLEAFNNYGLPPLPKVQVGEDLETTQLALQNSSLLDLQAAANSLKEQLGYAIKEPAVPFSTQAHRNAVWKSRNSNSYLQISENEEHIVLSHESGSHIQIDKNGNIKIKSFGDAYMLSEGHLFEGARGSKSLTVEGPYSLKCKNAIIDVEGDMTHTVKGNYDLNIGGRFTVSIGQGLEIASQRMSFETVSEHMNFKSAKKIKMAAGDNLSLKTSANLSMQSDSKIHAIGASGINLDGVPLHLNSDLAESIGSADQPVSPILNKPVQQTVTLNSTPRTTSTGTISIHDIDDIDTGE